MSLTNECRMRLIHVSCIRGKRLTRLVKWAVKIVQILKIAIEFSSDIYIDAFDILNQRMKNTQFFGLFVVFFSLLVCDNFQIYARDIVHQM